MSRVRIRAERIIDGVLDEPLTRHDVVVEDGRIVSIESAQHGDSGTDTVLAFPGATVLPGMIDMHAHVSFDMASPRTPYAEIADPAEVVAVRAVTYMDRKLRSGVTTARAMSERTFIAAALRDAQRSGLILAPRLYVAGLGIKASQAWGHTATLCRSPQEMRALIRENIAHGCSVTKVFLTNNGRRQADGNIPDILSDDELHTVIDESHRAGLPVAAHCHGGTALRRFVEAGGDTVEHGFFLTDDDLQLMAERGIWLVMTLGYLFDRCDLTGDDEGQMARDVAGDTYRRAIGAGVPVVVGTDDGPVGLAHELECLVAAGLSPMRAIRSATAEAAQCLRAPEVGRVATGMLADLLLVDGDPISDIRRLHHIKQVFQDGRGVLPAANTEA